MKISKEEVEYVAKLARLELQADEVDRMTAQLDIILNYVAKLDELDTTGVDSSSHSQQLSNAFREDVVQGSLLRDKALANGPVHNEEAFVVPKIIG